MHFKILQFFPVLCDIECTFKCICTTLQNCKSDLFKYQQCVYMKPDVDRTVASKNYKIFLHLFQLSRNYYRDRRRCRTNGRPRVNCLGCFSTKTSDPSKEHASRDNVHLAASLLSVETAGISSRQHIMYMYTCHRLTGTSVDSK